VGSRRCLEHHYAKAGVNSRFELASLIQNGLAPLARFELEDG